MNIGSKNKINPNFNMSSMTDIVFLLLIFFMLLSTMVQTSGMELQLPKSSGTAKPGKVVVVSVNKQKKYFVDGKEIPKEVLTTRLDKILANQEEPKVSIHAEVGTPVEELYYILDIAKTRGYKTVLATQPDDSAKE